MQFNKENKHLKQIIFITFLRHTINGRKSQDTFWLAKEKPCDTRKTCNISAVSFIFRYKTYVSVRNMGAQELLKCFLQIIALISVAKCIFSITVHHREKYLLSIIRLLEELTRMTEANNGFNLAARTDDCPNYREQCDDIFCIDIFVRLFCDNMLARRRDAEAIYLIIESSFLNFHV